MKIIEVTKANFEEEVLKADRPVLVDFNANWCGPCRMLRPILDEFECKDKNFKIVSINIDDNEELANQYKVYSIPCLVLMENGNELRRSVGLIDDEELHTFIGDK